MKPNEALWHDPSVAQRYVNAENATRPFAQILMQKANIHSLDKDAHVLDLATGTGAAIAELYNAVPKEKWSHLKVLGADVSQDMLNYLAKRGESEGWTGLETRVVDGNVCFARPSFPLPTFPPATLHR
jgi:ubiquinone/menaquinone biosynthesis C-methylase UbiE